MTLTDETKQGAVSRQRLTEIAETYQRLYGWPARYEAHTGTVVLRLGEVVDAIAMRAGFAAEVQAMLGIGMLAGPVLAVAHHRPRWVLLTQLATRTSTRQLVQAELGHPGVDMQFLTGTLTLPAPIASTEDTRWVIHPTVGGDLPPWSAVVAVARSLRAGRNW
ncbi:hypothetical protein GCM10010174_83980 [Kutzneria viridogrisea]|uniref:Uncharacterized protein n=2 Tax=Kutzneria TaxID=43356 RepID=W5WHR0_9PSEU|nr:hypothetical protein [Kutzneria albida]AHI00291.1 hypothetical protein KALB_6932 [Kutzneria albida DSM 43870]MBA8925469.1 hypothetical protein [Kutzneria viridogrisea]